MSLLKAFDKSFSKDKEYATDIIDFAVRYCKVTPTLPQRVILKIFAGESLHDKPVFPHKISEKDWFELMHDRGRFPPDTKERMESNDGSGFRNILLVVGRRGGKSTVISVAALYSVYRVLQYDDPQAHYNIQRNEPISVAVAATSARQSERSPFSKIESICKTAIAEQTPLAKFIDKDGIKARTIFFKSENDKKVERELRKKGIRNRRISSVHLEAYSSNIDSFRGGAVITAILDEFAQFPVTQNEIDTADYFYNTLAASLTQFKKDAKMFILSTPRGKLGKFYDIYLEAWTGKLPSTIGMKMPSWEAWEHEPARNQQVTLQSLAEDDNVSFYWDKDNETMEEALDRSSPNFKMEYGAEFQGAEEQWLPSALISNIDPTKGFFRKHLRKINQGIVGTVYTVHVDAARTTDSFALAVVHKEIIDERETFIVDHAYRWYVAPSYDYNELEEHEKAIYQTGPEPAFIHTSLPMDYLKFTILARFNVARLTFDQFQSYMFTDELARHCFQHNIPTAIDVVHFNQNFNKKRAENFEQLLYEHRVMCYDNPIIERELTGLQKDKFGKVEKGPLTNDDLYDCISAAILNASDLPETIDRDTKRDLFYNVNPVFPTIRM